jgi:capsular exopolysaccharide synthesis family protein
MSRIADALNKAGLTAGESPTPDSAALEAFAATTGSERAEPAVRPMPLEEPRLAERHRAAESHPRSGTSNRFAIAAAQTSGAPDDRLLISPRVDHVGAKQYRRLASGLHQLQGERPLRSLLVTSTMAGEGKTLTSANLALALSESFRRRVLLIDADLRRPALDGLFNLKAREGLATALAGAGLEVRVMQVTPRLAVLPGGAALTDPVGVLTSDRMRELLAAATEAFDWVIIDTPPLGVAPDASLLSMFVDGVLLVIHASSTKSTQVQKVMSAIPPERLVGAVLNRAERVALAEYEYHSDAATGENG